MACIGMIDIIIVAALVMIEENVDFIVLNIKCVCQN